MFPHGFFYDRFNYHDCPALTDYEKIEADVARSFSHKDWERLPKPEQARLRKLISKYYPRKKGKK